MHRLSMLLLPWALACRMRCGSYTVATGFDFGGTPIDDDKYFEACGIQQGSWGSWDLYGDGTAEISFETSHRNSDMDWNSVPIEMYAEMPIDRMKVGESFAAGVDLTGYAELVDSNGGHYASAALVEGTLDVLEYVDDGEDPCTVEDGPTFKLEWKGLVWETGEYRYAADGKDKVRFDTFLSETCGNGWD